MDVFYNEYYYLPIKDFIKIGINKGFNKKELILYYKNQYSNLITNKIINKNYYKILPIINTYQIDLVSFSDSKNLFWLYIINIPSRYVWVIYIKNKNDNCIYNAFINWYYNFKDHIEENKRVIESITCDQESTFIGNNTLFNNFIKNERIKIYYKYKYDHKTLSILDHSVYLIKKLLLKNLSKIKMKFNFNMNNYNDVINLTIDQYNNTPKNILFGLTPYELFNDIHLQYEIYNYILLLNKLNKNIDKFNVGDLVIINEVRKNKLQKQRINKSKIYKIINKNKYSYKIGDMNGNIIDKYKYRNFKHYELQKINMDINKDEINNPRKIIKLINKKYRKK